MKLWKIGSLNDAVEMPTDEVARLYLESRWARAVSPLDRKVRAFLTDPHGPISAACEAGEFDELLTQILDLRD